MKISIIEPTGLDPSEYQKALPGHEVISFDSRGWPDTQLIDSLKDTNIIVLSNRPLSGKVISSLPNLKLISVAFAGIDHVDLESTHQRNIPVKNAGGYANTAVAELVIGFMICLARNIPKNNENIRNQGTTNTGTELNNKTIGIIGLGAIGREVKQLGEAFRMETLVYNKGDASDVLKHLFSTSDYVTLHIPLLPETRNFVSLDLLKLMKPTAYLINCARGPIVNSTDLKYALENHLIAGAALDVFDIEPPLPKDHILLNAPNLIATPHIGYNTKEALIEKGIISLQNILNYIRGG